MMSCFDTVHCKMALPNDAPNFAKKSPWFQTYDLGRGMGDYVITENGEFQIAGTAISGILCEAFGVKDMPPMPISWKRKRIEMWCYSNEGNITYIVQVRNGKVSSIKEKYRKIG